MKSEFFGPINLKCNQRNDIYIEFAEKELMAVSVLIMEEIDYAKK